MSNTSSIVQDIPLSRLVATKVNVRHTNRTAQIGQLAASIKAHGLLQNLTVRPSAAARNGSAKTFDVIAGGRRLAALRLLAKRKDINADTPVRCQIIADAVPEEISLAENLQQCPCTPPTSTKRLPRCMSADDIAARFGLSATILRQRLKLGAVSPALMAVYRSGDMDLEQLSAFAITDDHAAQERGLVAAWP